MEDIRKSIREASIQDLMRARVAQNIRMDLAPDSGGYSNPEFEVESGMFTIVAASGDPGAHKVYNINAIRLRWEVFTSVTCLKAIENSPMLL